MPSDFFSDWALHYIALCYFNILVCSTPLRPKIKQDIVKGFKPFNQKYGITCRFDFVNLIKLL